MKVLSVNQIREADGYTIVHEPIDDLMLMERAATTCYEWLITNIRNSVIYHIFCGTGNNGGDGLVIARLLARKGIGVNVYLAGDPNRMTPSCRSNFQRLRNEHPEVTVLGLDPVQDDVLDTITAPGEDDIILDAVFGSGLTRIPEGFFANVIDKINSLGEKCMVISIDMPSGLFCDSSVSGAREPSIVKADQTLSFEPPKLAFFMPENHQYLGDWVLHDIGIHPDFLDFVEVKNHMVTMQEAAMLVKPRSKFDHKGTFGHALLYCGSYGKMGAAVLSASACLRTGAGLVTLRCPSMGVGIIQTALPEAMVIPDEHEHFLANFNNPPDHMTIGAGPGIGTANETALMLKLLIQHCRKPMVIDADALNILSENKTWLSFLPQGCILTPHPKEFERLAGKSQNHFERNEMQRAFSVRFGVYVVLKGAHTAITTPSGQCFFNTTGNPGMATGGSGDVLTGILTSLLAQGYTALDSCILGVFLHGLAGDLALQETGFESLVASDLIRYLGKSFQQLYGKF
jgi:NAD(P)H-hydrate epimerase